MRRTVFRWFAPLVWCALFLSLPTAVAGSLTVAVAANLIGPFGELREAFKAESGHTLIAISNSSGKLATQIQQGAAFDVFLSADLHFPQILSDQGLTSAAPKVYAYGQLVLWSPRARELKNWQALLRGSEIKHIAIANPRLAPYGEQTMAVLRYYGLEPAVRGKLVLGESIAQTTQLIYTQSAELGFTAYSAVLMPNLAQQGSWLLMPATAYTPIAQGLVILKTGQQREPLLTQEFYRWMFSATARGILARYGYLLPGAAGAP